MEHKTTRVIPRGKSAAALVKALQAAIGVKSDGYRTEKDGRIILIFTQTATQADINTAIQIAETWDFDTKTDEEQAIHDIVVVAQSAVGVGYADLTLAQLKALLAVLLYESGGIGAGGVVLPLARWVNHV